MSKSYFQRVQECEWQGDAISLYAAEGIASEADSEVQELRQEVDSLQDRIYELEREPWPEWTTEILKMVREKSGYDGYDDQDEGVDIVEEVRECIEEMTQQIEKADARIAALEAENAKLREVLTKAREDINWMVNSGATLNGFVFDYIDAALATQPKGETNE